MGSSNEGSQEGSDDDYSMLGDLSSDEPPLLYKKNGEVDWDAYEKYINRPDVNRMALCNLVKYSLLMFTFPFITMYAFYYYLKERTGYTSESALVPAAVVAAFVVFVIAAKFVCVAYSEEKKDMELKESLKKRE